MFIISLTYTCDLPTIEQHLTAHRHYLDKHYGAGIFLASGRKEPRNGGVILAHNIDRATLDSILKQDPFYSQQLARYEVTEFIPSKTSPKLTFLCR